MPAAQTRRSGRRERRAAARAAARARGAAPEAGAGTAPSLREPGEASGLFAGFSRTVAAGVLALAFMVSVSYFPALSGGFVWDDVIFADEEVVHRWSGLWSIWFSPADIRKEGHYWPLVYTSFWLEHKLWGLRPLGYHAVNVLLHLVNALLVWRLALRLSVPGAWALAALFSVHPLHVESVAWIIERKDLLSAMFYLAAALVWIRFAEAPRRGRYCLALALFAAGLLSKSIVVTLPAALLLWHWWERGRIVAADAIRLAPFFAVGFCITLADFVFYTGREPLSLGYTPVERVLIAARALWFYTGKLIWPSDLAVIYPLWEISVLNPLSWLYAAAAAGIGTLLWCFRHRLGRGPLAGIAFFVVTLSPTLGFVDYGYMQFSFVADRFQYLAGIGVMAVLAGAAYRGARRLPGVLRIASAGAFVVVLVLLGTLTWRQSGIYRDEVTFFSHIVALNPKARDAHLNLGSALFEAERFEEGYIASLIALEQRPDSAAAHDNLGRALLLMKRLDEAGQHLERALELDPRSATARQNMAELRRKQGRLQEAAEGFRSVLARDESNALAHAGLGVSLYEMERYDEAVDSMARALELAPDRPGTRALHGLSGRALELLGRLDEAERSFIRAVKLTPDDLGVLVDLFALLFSQQRVEEADQHLRRALDLASGNAPALQSVAEALRKRGLHEESIGPYRAALAVDAELAMAHAGLGDALYRLERYEEAIESLGRSLTLHSQPPTATARLVLMGSASRALGRPEAAVEFFERAVEIDPRNADALDHLAMLRFEEERYEEALALYRTLAEIRPDGAQTHSNLGATLYYLGRPEDALRSFERALSLDPDLETARNSRDRLTESLRPRAP